MKLFGFSSSSRAGWLVTRRYCFFSVDLRYSSSSIRAPVCAIWVTLRRTQTFRRQASIVVIAISASPSIEPVGPSCPVRNATAAGDQPRKEALQLPKEHARLLWRRRPLDDARNRGRRN